MRHVATLIAAIVIAPVAWVMIAFGQERSAQAFARAHGGSVAHPGEFLRPLLLLAGAGILVGLLATLRLSPLGAVLTGAVYAASYVTLLIDPTWLLNRLDHNISIAGRRAELSTPVRTGTTLLLGALLLVAVASVGRWRRWPRPSDDEPKIGAGVDSQQAGLGSTDEQDPATGHVTGSEPVANLDSARR